MSCIQLVGAIKLTGDEVRAVKEATSANERILVARLAFSVAKKNIHRHVMTGMVGVAIAHKNAFEVREAMAIAPDHGFMFKTFTDPATANALDVLANSSSWLKKGDLPNTMSPSAAGFVSAFNAATEGKGKKSDQMSLTSNLITNYYIKKEGDNQSGQRSPQKRRGSDGGEGAAKRHHSHTRVVLDLTTSSPAVHLPPPGPSAVLTSCSPRRKSENQFYSPGKH
eukprot:GHVU01046725.1.p1 GENE.GHVU01046725.1~~GHVU01046725.1.p1  ORF type:complete len:224 (-),score=25.73 GHVU01046725.1:43-714(-)